MKKLYTYLLAAIIAMCASGTAKAEIVSITFEWDIPGSLTFQRDNKDYPVDANATSFTYYSEDVDDPGWDIPYDDRFRFKANGDYEISSIIATNGSKTKEFTVMNNGWSQTISFDEYYGYTVKIKVQKAAEPDASVKVKVHTWAAGGFGANFDKSGEIKQTWGAGEFELPYISSKDTQITFYANNSSYAIEGEGDEAEEVHKKFAKFLHNGHEVTTRDNWGQTMYDVTLTGNDLVEIWCVPGEVETKSYTTTLTINNPAAIKSIFDQTSYIYLYNGTGELPGSFKCDENTVLQFNFSNDATINSIKVNGEDQTYDGSGSFRYTVTADATLAIEAAEKVYSTYQLKAYISNAEGVKVRYGGTTEYLDLGRAYDITADIELPAISSASAPAYTLSTENTKLYYLHLSDKYENVIFENTDGYYLNDIRVGDMKTCPGTMSAEIKSQQVWVPCIKINNDDLFRVYVAPGFENTLKLKGTSVQNDVIYNTLTEGWNEVYYDKGYISTWQLMGADASTVAYLNNNKVIYSDSESSFPAFAMIGDDVVKIYPAAPAVYTVDFKQWGDAEIVCDGARQLYGSNELKVPAPTTLTFKPDQNSKLYVDYAAADLDENGVYTLDVTSNHYILVDNINNPFAKYTLTPDPAETQESIASITITFPNVLSATQEGSDDEILFVADGNAWAPVRTTIEAVEGAIRATYTISFTPEATMMTGYRLLIPEGFFKLEKYAYNSDIEVSYTVEKEITEVTYEFNPYSDIRECNPWGIDGAIVFDESMQIASYDESKMTVTVDGTPIEVEYMTEMNSLMFGDYSGTYGNTACTLVWTLEEGAITLKGGAKSPAASKTWQYVEPKEYSWAITPDVDGSEIGDLDMLYIVFTNAESGEIYNQNGVNLAEEGYAANNYNHTAKIEAVEGAANPTFAVSFPVKPTKSTTYTLTARQGTFTLDGYAESPEIKKTFSLTTGIDGIIVEGEEGLTIHTINGIQLRADWKNLPAGVYIVNGKKALKK